MANENLKRIKDLASRMEKTGSKKTAPTAPRPTTVSTVASADAIIENLDKEFFAPYEQPSNTYDVASEIDRLRKMQNGEIKGNFETSRMPHAILESFQENPLIVDPTIVEDPKMTALAEKISKRSSGVERMTNIVKKMDEQDSKQKAMVNEELLPKTSGGIDYSAIKAIVESVIDAKLNQITESINRQSSGQSLKCMTIKDNNFMFLTDDGDIYECKMTYKGKNKRH